MLFKALTTILAAVSFVTASPVDIRSGESTAARPRNLGDVLIRGIFHRFPYRATASEPTCKKLECARGKIALKLKNGED